MARIILNIIDAAASAHVEGKLTAGAVGIPIEVNISGERWDGLAPKLIARCGDLAVPMVIAGGESEMPHECLIAGATPELAVDGWDDAGTKRIPTMWAKLSYVYSSADNANLTPPTPPTPDMERQILAAAQEAVSTANEADHKAQGVVDDAASGKFNGKDGAPGKDGLPGRDGVDGKDYILTDADKKQIAGMVPAYDDTKIKKEQIELKEGLTQCLKEPDGMAVGKYFRIAAIDENGHAVLEAVDAPSSGVSDVQANGVSVVQDGVANIPKANIGVMGVIKTGENHGVYTTSDGILTTVRSSNASIDNRGSQTASTIHNVIVPLNLDYAVKAAMCDGKGEEWTPEEQAAAQQRIGILSVEEVLF